MDLILFQPGDQTIMNSEGSELDNSAWVSDGPTGLCIEIVSLHQGMKQQLTTDVSNNARTSGRPIITEFTLVKYVDQTSVKLYEYCLGAKVLGSGADAPSTIYIARESGGSIQNVIKIELKDALLSEMQLQTHPNDMPTEQFKLNFTEIIWTYTQQFNDTTQKGMKTAGWSLAKNTPIAGKFTSGK
ncbi:Hcp family type VI secretion system effector [Trinickia dinghuensis]|uniref:Hcp1 family type VI secretion system effector n=1 Tax=Trinickia dinghuensis TaxID=2291023 RepID=A0A3D8JPD6_9BURK|nr:type VI secretion system tube protein Hcp [Trinickia dinghuensis]RDU94740.1 Hcp1 family type VI secretion system effector [Trinickia dinghuensis]